MGTMRAARGGRAAGWSGADEEETPPAFGIVIWPGAGTETEEPALPPVARVRLREVFAPVAAAR